MTAFKIAVMDGVCECTESCPVELWLNEAGKVVIRAYNECGNNYTDVDLSGLIDWLRAGSNRGGINATGIAAIPASERN